MITLTLQVTGLSMYVTIVNSAGLYWNGATFEAYNASHWATYAVALTESPNYTYSVAFPSAIVTAGAYSLQAYKQVGGSPATSDSPTRIGGYGDLYWNGTSEIVPVASGASSLTFSIGI